MEKEVLYNKYAEGFFQHAPYSDEENEYLIEHYLHRPGDKCMTKWRNITTLKIYILVSVISSVMGFKKHWWPIIFSDAWSRNTHAH